MIDAAELFMIFKRVKTRDVLWLLLHAKIDNAAEWLQRKGHAMHEWGARARKEQHD